MTTIDDYNEFVQLFKDFSQIDLGLYKETQMKRRLTSFRDKYGYKSHVEMLMQMKRDNDLYQNFLDKMTINVTEFFRNSNIWDRLEKEVLPVILKNNPSPKFWSAACSTGEEPYSLSMLLSEYLPMSKISILATDLDTSVLEKAKNGKYMRLSMRDVAQAVVNKFFTLNNDFYEISNDIKKTVRFQQQNLLRDKFEENFDLIICRNVVIYFTDEAKHDLYMKFASSLKPQGYLFIGSTEQIFEPQLYGLEPVGTFIYRKL